MRETYLQVRPPSTDTAESLRRSRPGRHVPPRTVQTTPHNTHAVLPTQSPETAATINRAGCQAIRAVSGRSLRQAASGRYCLSSSITSPSLVGKSAYCIWNLDVCGNRGLECDLSSVLKADRCQSIERPTPHGVASVLVQLLIGAT